ncbi:hypothetical protein QBC39DRAFT_26557 [Podospora conica]|nr:hypothetical protein QBC39DRAFT_26557 [Schizothecium conicum]
MADDNGPPMVITMVVCTAASFVFMSLRFFCKHLMSTRLASDDAVLVLAWLLALVYVAISIKCTEYGLGKRMAEMDLTLLPQLLYLIPIGQFFAVCSIAASKSSFILTLLRLITMPWQKWSLWFMLATINGSMLSIAIAQFFQCAAPGQTNCVPGDRIIGLGVFAAAYSAILDLVLTAFPTVIIWKLQMIKREKIGIILSMSLGVIAGVVGLYKSSTIPYVSRDADFIYRTPIVLIWVIAEVTATILAASIPFFRPLVRKVSQYQKSSGKESSNSFGMGRMGGRSGHSKLGSRSDVQSKPGNSDNDSDHGILPPRTTNKNVVHKTEVYTVEYESADDVEKATGPSSNREQARQMF